MAKGSLISPFKIFGIGNKRRQFEADRDALQGKIDTGLQSYQDFELEEFKPTTVNPFEDMTVNFQAADFQREMQAQQQADTLQALRGAGGAAGAASLAAAMSRQAAEKERAIAADIGSQEQAISLASAEQQAANQAIINQAEQANIEARNRLEQERMTTMLGIDMAQLTGLEQAEQARKDRNMQLLGAGLGVLGAAAGGLAQGGMANLGEGETFFGKKR
jgi:hypothetical protein